MGARLRFRPKPKPVRANPERELQKAVFALIRFNRVPLLIAFHVPNEAKRAARSPGFYQSIGMLPGVADICCVLPGGRVAFLELKAPGKYPSRNQKAFARECDANGTPYAVARTLEEAAGFLAFWGAIRDNPFARQAERRAA